MQQAPGGRDGMREQVAAITPMGPDTEDYLLLVGVWPIVYAPLTIECFHTRADSKLQ